MVDVFKIINEFTDIDTKIIFELNHITHSGRHNKLVVRHHNRLDACRKFNLIGLRNV